MKLNGHWVCELTQAENLLSPNIKCNKLADKTDKYIFNTYGYKYIFYL